MSHNRRVDNLGNLEVSQVWRSLTGPLGGDLQLTTVNRFNGDLLVPARFWSKVRVGAAEACWPWTASRQPSGYGQFAWASRFGRQWPGYAHRIAWELINGPIPAGQSVLHHCDNPPCCNPAHLRVGTQADNMRDAQERDRLHVQRPSGHKLTDAQINDALLSIRAGEKQQDAARRLGVTEGYISQLVHGTARPYRDMGASAFEASR